MARRLLRLARGGGVAPRPQQRGELRTAPEQGWMPAEAEQDFTVDEPGFVDERGRFREMTARRWMGAGEKATLEQWFIPATEWREMDGLAVPVKGEAIWRLKGGDFSYYRWEITALRYDRPAA